MIEITLGEYLFVIGFCLVAGAIFALGLYAFLRTWVAERHERRARVEYTPADDDWLDSWGIRP